MVAQARGDFAAAEGWYRKSLEIEERFGNEHGAGLTYHQLGVVAHERGDFAAAEGWYRKALEISERRSNELGAATSYGALGLLYDQQAEPIRAIESLLKALAGFVAGRDEHMAQLTLQHIARIHASQPRDQQLRVETMWAEAGFGDFPKANNTAG